MENSKFVQQHGLEKFMQNRRRDILVLNVEELYLFMIGNVASVKKNEIARSLFIKMEKIVMCI